MAVKRSKSAAAENVPSAAKLKTLQDALSNMEVERDDLKDQNRVLSQSVQALKAEIKQLVRQVDDWKASY